MINKWLDWLIIDLPNIFGELSNILFTPLIEYIRTIDGPFGAFINFLPDFITDIFNFSLIELLGVGTLVLIILFKISILIFNFITFGG